MPVPSRSGDDLGPLLDVAGAFVAPPNRAHGSVRQDPEGATPSCGDAHSVGPVVEVALPVTVPARGED